MRYVREDIEEEVMDKIHEAIIEGMELAVDYPRGIPTFSRQTLDMVFEIIADYDKYEVM